ncbi:MAG TPA: LysR family transcriptional regulator [Limnobacter sp.]|uniref:LysR family transcriptional regulator n=1 Tax=Limnobacter sp. TaxID=2003368 RepID=UPI002ED87CDE
MSNNFNELHAAEAFVQVMNTGSFAAAAKLRGENPSSVSRAIAQLESHLGVRLLNRTTRNLRITEAGTTYLRYVRELLEHQQAVRDALLELRSGTPKGLVRLSVPVVVGEHILAKYLGEFHQQYPEVNLQIDLSNRNAQLVEEGIDLALRFGVLADSSLRARRVSTIWRRMYASPAYLQAHGIPKTPKDLIGHQCIAFSQRGDVKEWEFWPKAGGVSQKHKVDSWLTCSSPMMVVNAIASGLGVGRSAPWMVKQALGNGEVVEILSDWHCDDPQQGGLPMYIVFPPGPSAQVPLKSRVVAEFLENVLLREFGVERSVK